jgi:midasin (ATPase involved in ribosome maturation)
MKESGKLISTECSVVGITGSISGLKIVQVHENFRILLSTNAELWEVSRAVRNRCAEVHFLSPSELLSQQSVGVKCIELLSSGIRSVALANAITGANANEQFFLDIFLGMKNIA